VKATGFKKKQGVAADFGSPSGSRQNPPLRFVLHPVDWFHPYLSQRGIDRQTAEGFQVGLYSGPGLLHGRVVIPIHNPRGQLVGYAGRATDRTEPRYKFPAGFQKSPVLFNLHRAVRSGCRQVVVVEGFFDCLRVHQAGYPTVVALMGTGLSEAQQKLLLDHFEEVVLMLDGDEAGRRAARRIVAQLGSQVCVYRAEVPEGSQPDQLSPTQIRALLDAKLEAAPSGSPVRPAERRKPSA
jgi:DNA primase